MTDFLLIAFVFLVAGVVAVPIATRLGLGSVLGYLIAGIVISPLLTVLGVDVMAIQHLAEFGVVMMLFLVGLELEPRVLWAMRTKLLGLGGLQVAGTTAAVMGIAIALGQPWTIAVAIGFVLALSSTAIVLQTLNEKGLMRSAGGKSSFAVLLFQDIAVIPMLAFIPLLAMPELMDAAQGLASATGHGAEAALAGESHAVDAGEGGGHAGTFSLVAGLNGWQTALMTMGAIGAVILGGAYLTRPVFRFIAAAGLRELFVATALLFVIGIALLMIAVGLSPALGTFLAGVVLANSEYRHELESDIDPFRGLLLGLFFITVGAGIDFALLFDRFGVILALTLGLIGLKFGVLMLLGWLFRLPGGDRWLFSLGLAQAGEFGFVLLSFTVANRVIPQPVADQLLLIVALSMLLTPALFILHEKLVSPRFAKMQERDPDTVDETGDIIIAGHGRFGGIVNRMLRAAGYSTTVLDYNAAQLDLLRAFGFKVFYGDATRPDMLHAAGIDKARLLVVAIDGKEQINAIVHYVRKTYPHVKIVTRAVDRHHVYDLFAAGCTDIVRETFDSSVRTGRTAYEAMGMHPFEAEQLARKFAEDDRHVLQEMAEVFDPDIPTGQNLAYIEKTRTLMEERDAQIFGKSQAFDTQANHGWLPPSSRDTEAVMARHAQQAKSD
ncbi:cation:proton antiporter [Labrenzia sp. 011]|uniref:cation:proton antiporter domain-containing protein n=1 Tax=Labrenzia sp. 011 TaxID=2171494 RepID=UPI000D51641C|nr:cation:proton antiporter [Labrenzia sp. 011]PVB63709.1 potassium transporter [Labrenzia sp. 011]